MWIQFIRECIQWRLNGIHTQEGLFILCKVLSNIQVIRGRWVYDIIRSNRVGSRRFLHSFIHFHSFWWIWWNEQRQKLQIYVGAGVLVNILNKLKDKSFLRFWYEHSNDYTERPLRANYNWGSDSSSKSEWIGQSLHITTMEPKFNWWVICSQLILQCV